jgi:hypothetical protein
MRTDIEDQYLVLVDKSHFLVPGGGQFRQHHKRACLLPVLPTSLTQGTNGYDVLQTLEGHVSFAKVALT